MAMNTATGKVRMKMTYETKMINVPHAPYPSLLPLTPPSLVFSITNVGDVGSGITGAGPESIFGALFSLQFRVMLSFKKWNEL